MLTVKNEINQILTGDDDKVWVGRLERQCLVRSKENIDAPLFQTKVIGHQSMEN
jgi:hypothetical protein